MTESELWDSHLYLAASQHLPPPPLQTTAEDSPPAQTLTRGASPSLTPSPLPSYSTPPVGAARLAQLCCVLPPLAPAATNNV